MMHRPVIGWVLGLMLAVGTPGRGQSSWTLERCLSVGMERSSAVQTAKNLAHLTELSKLELGTSALPQLKLRANALFAPTFGRFGYDPVITNKGELEGQVVLQQSVYDGGVRNLKFNQFEVEAEQRSIAVRRAERDVAFSIRQAFIDLLRARRESILQQESVRQLEEYLALVRRLAKGGTASATDVLKAEVQLANAQTSLQRAEESSEISLIALKQAVGLPADTVSEVTGTLETMSIEPADSSTLTRLGIPESNLEISQISLESAKSLFDAEIARREFSPTVSVTADAGLATSGENFALPPEDREPMVGFSAGITLEIPLMNWGATDLRVQQRQIISDNLRLERDQAERTVKTQAALLRLQFSRALQRLRSARQTMTAAEENYLLTKSKFVAGSSLSLEVLTAQQLLTDSRLSETQALADIQSALARIDHMQARR